MHLAPYIRTIAIAAAMMSAVGASAQDSLLLIDLETVLKLGGARNLTIQAVAQQQDMAAAELDKAREWWLPDIYVGARVHQLWGTTMNADGFFFTDVNRQNFWGGVGLDVTWDLGRGIFLPDARELQVRASVYATAAERNNSLLRVVDVYFDLLNAQLAFVAYDKLVQQGDTIAQQIGVQVDAGMRYQSEYLLARSNQRRLQVEMMSARIDYLRQSAALARLLNLAPDIKLLSVDSVLAPISLGTTNEPPTTIDSIYVNRPDLLAASLRLESLHSERRLTTTALLLPSLRVATFTSMFGNVFTPLYPTSAVNVSMMWKIPLGLLVYGGDVQRYDVRIELQQTEIDWMKARVNEELQAASATLRVVQLQIDLAKEASDLAQMALDQSVQRQEFGTVKPFEILQAQEVFIKARLDYLKSVALFNKTQYQLYVAAGNNL